MKKPKKENYGWVENSRFDSEPLGFVVEGGEEAYNEAMFKYYESQTLELTDKVERLNKMIEKHEELINHMDKWFGNGNVRLIKLRKELQELKGE